jgi:type II secretory pathway pseudopilin PulG
MRAKNGWTLTEVLILVAVIGLFAGITGSAVDRGRRHTALRGAVSEMRSVFQEVRMMAIARNCNVAIKFRYERGEWTYAVYEDGDRDGVRNDDINRRIDREVVARRRLMYVPARIGVPGEPVPDPANGRLLTDRSAVRFGTSTLCSFSRHGEATNGSLVLTDGEHAVLLRVTGTSARIHVMLWQEGSWRSAA